MVTLLRRGGRQRKLQSTAEHVVAALRAEQLAARPVVVGAYAASTTALVAVIAALSAQVNVFWVSRWVSLLAGTRTLRSI
ncbi:hypothetical protein [Nakamurella panacisegetis]|uniref:hypothetical protein n=1 Tax=Nakamurella panacisegetis TaxID=1090615 RepID=UPI000B803811|nr:hypothetical protein [Nakamurella panacisegetis]